jgi:hypothetical protein
MGLAASNNSAAVIPLLLAAMADPNAKNKFGYSFKFTTCNVLFLKRVFISRFKCCMVKFQGILFQISFSPKSLYTVFDKS